MPGNTTLLENPKLFTFIHISTVGAFCLNIFCIFVITHYSPPKMQSYARYLLLYQIGVTYTDLILMWLVAPWLLFPVPGLIPTGPLTAMGMRAEQQVVMVLFAIACTIVFTGELFFQRQQSIVPNGSWLKLKKRQLHFANCSLGSIVVFLLIVAYYYLQYNECNREHFASKFPTLRKMILRDDFFCLADDYIQNTVAVGIFILVVSIAILLVVVGSSIYYLYKYDFCVSQRTRDMQKVMLKVLVIQTTVPFVFLLGPERVLSVIRRQNKVDLVDWNPWLLLVFCMHGPCSTVLVLLLYAPYLEFMKRLFGIPTKKVVARSSKSLQLEVDVTTVVEQHNYHENRTKRCYSKRTSVGNQLTIFRQ